MTLASPVRPDDTGASTPRGRLDPSAVAGSEELRQAFGEIKRVIVGQDTLIERLLVALLARGHVLLEGVPGLAKTLAVRTVAEVVGGTFRRIQFTPDLVPADLVGTRIYRQATGDFGVELGPVFANLLLADEINRAPAKVQSALLEVMQERQVTIGSASYQVPDPFLVLATQNPIEHDGTYQLPEAQVDRFMFKVIVGYPDLKDELEIVARVTGAPASVAARLSPERLRWWQAQADRVMVDPRLHEYAVNLVAATRNPALFDLGHLKRFVTYGASPRASINMVTAARAIALLRGRQYALAEDVWTLASDILRHRLVLSYEALAEDVAVTDVIDQILERVPAPQLGYAGELTGPVQRPERILAANTVGAAAPMKRRWWHFGRRA